MPRTPLRELKPELFADEYETDSDDDSASSSGNTGLHLSTFYIYFIFI